MVGAMVTVAIVGMLSTFAVAAVRDATRRAKISKATTQLHMIAAAVRKLAWDTGRYPLGMSRVKPTGDEAWDLSTASVGLLRADDDDFPHWKGPYISRIPKDPWGQPYFFDSDYSHDGRVRVAVGSFGPNRSGRNDYDADNIVLFLDK